MPTGFQQYCSSVSSAGKLWHYIEWCLKVKLFQKQQIGVGNYTNWWYEIYHSSPFVILFSKSQIMFQSKSQHLTLRMIDLSKGKRPEKKCKNQHSGHFSFKRHHLIFLIKLHDTVFSIWIIYKTLYHLPKLFSQIIYIKIYRI
jgi:hypothetical protein